MSEWFDSQMGAIYEKVFADLQRGRESIQPDVLP